MFGIKAKAMAVAMFSLIMLSLLMLLLGSCFTAVSSVTHRVSLLAVLFFFLVFFFFIFPLILFLFVFRFSFFSVGCC